MAKRSGLFSGGGIGSARKLQGGSREEMKLTYRMKRNDYKFRGKIMRDMEEIRAVISDMSDTDSVMMITNAFDLPNILRAYVDEMESLYMCTFSIGATGLAAIKEAVSSGVHVLCLLDDLFLHKNYFALGGVEVLGDNVKFKFAKTHAKFVAFSLRGGGCICVTGSANMTKNPRIEVIHISRSRDEFEFLRKVITDVKDIREIRNGKTQDTGGAPEAPGDRKG